MSRPWKHPKTGVYYLRKRVPADLRDAVGCETVKKSLATKNPAEAKKLFLSELQKLELRWTNMRLGAQTLSERQAHSLAVKWYAVWFTLNRDEPSGQRVWRTDLYERLWTAQVPDLIAGPLTNAARLTLRDDLQIGAMRQLCVRGALGCLQINGLSIDLESHIKLERAIGSAYQRASLLLKKQSEGYDLTIDPNLFPGGSSVFPQGVPRNSSNNVDRINDIRQSSRKRYSISSMLTEWWAEAKAAGRKPSTFESYRNTIKLFVGFMKHDDAGGITATDIIAFKDFRLKTPSAKTGRLPSAKTVKDSDLSALKTLFGWAVSNQKIETNPALEIKIKLAKPQRLRSKDFSDEEAQAILSRSHAYINNKEHAKTAAAKRWVPWLCAFTGARVGEIAQLRRQDVSMIDSRWVIRITPEAGTVKTNEARQVVLHRQIIELGFIIFAQSSDEGHLFLQPNQNGDVLGQLQGLKNRLAEFSRAIVPDKGVAPNHGWRHRFKTIGINAEIAPRILDAIQGQAPRTVADTYGEVSLKAIAAAIDRLPHFIIEDFNSMAKK